MEIPISQIHSVEIPISQIYFVEIPISQIHSMEIIISANLHFSPNIHIVLEYLLYKIEKISVILNIFNHILITPMKCFRVQYLNILASSVLIKKHPEFLLIATDIFKNQWSYSKRVLKQHVKVNILVHKVCHTSVYYTQSNMVVYYLMACEKDPHHTSVYYTQSIMVVYYLMACGKDAHHTSVYYTQSIMVVYY